jgi:hypothetical protein
MTLGAASRLLVIIFIFASGCDRAATLTPPAHVTRVDVTDNNTHLIKRIDSQRKIDAIVKFVSQHRSGWTRPLTGVPVGQLYANFYNEDKFLGHFGIGPGFFETSLAGDLFRSRRASEPETHAFIVLLDVKDTHIR